MFTAVYTDLEHMRRPKDKGRYRSIVWVRRTCSTWAG